MKFRYIVSAVSILALAACQSKDDPKPGPQPEPPVIEPVTLSLSSSFQNQTKTALGELSAGVYPVYWTDGDRVCVNGVKSSTAFGLEENCTSADFTVRGVEAPYHIVYPSIICGEISEEGSASVTIPVAQAYVKDSFASGSAILYGSTEGTSCQLRNLCGVIRLPLLKGAEWGGNIKTITISSKSTESPLSGEFILDTVEGGLEPVECDASVFLSLPAEGINLDASTPEYFFISIPGGDYPQGFSIILGSDEGTMLCDWVGETAVPAGIVVSLDPIAYRPNNTKLIDSIDSWNEFAAAVNAGDYERWLDPDTGEATIVADISYGGDLTLIDALPAGMVINGGGHIIKRASATEPLFTLINEGATVKNLTIGGNRTGLCAVSTDDRGTGNLAAYNRGTIDNCVNQMNVTLSDIDRVLKIGGMVTDNAGVIKDSRNEGDIVLNFNISANRNVYGGSFAAVAHRNLDSVQYCGDFINCVNKGSIVINRTATGIFSMTKFSLGGIVGCVEQGTKDGEHSLIQGCTNSGNITYWQDSKHTNANYGYAVGGIVGRNCQIAQGPDYYFYVGGANATSYSGYYVEIKDCSFTGNIDASIYSAAGAFNMSGARQVYVGGVVGCFQSAWDNPAVISGCTVKGDIRTGHTSTSDCTGGICGGAGYGTISNCTVDANFGLSRNTLCTATNLGFVGGAVGFVTRDLTLKDCAVSIGYDKGSAAKTGGVGFVCAVAKHTNISANVATSGMATLTLAGENTFTGTIGGTPVTADQAIPGGSLGRVVGSVTIK